MRVETAIRPTFGALRCVHSSAASIALVDANDVEANGKLAANEEPSLLSPSRFRDYDALASRIVALRREGHAVAVNLGK